MVKIPESTIEQIKARADILEVISEVVQLQRRGTSYFGLCPFHDDKRPSFSVAPAKGIYRCFSCGVGGNVITFVMEYDKITFVEALKKLAERYNIPITWEDSADEGKSSEISQLYELHEHARNLFQKQLFSAEGKTALQYLQGRGFTNDVIKNFSIGYATSNWDDLLKHINRKVYNDSILEASGLFIERKNSSGHFDRFRNRVMFPIKNISGRTIAFGGRALDPNDNAKYMNSPETKIYNKSDVLFGFDIAKDFIRKREFAIVVEGYTDFLRIYLAGYENVVAGSGTALTEGHSKVLKRFTNKVLLCYDGDEAGQKAAVRAGFIFLKAGFDVKVINLPEEEDPDSFIVKNGNDAFTEKVENASSFINFILERNRDKLNSPVEKGEFIERMVKEISEVQDLIVRDFIVKSLAERINLNEERIFGQMKHFLNKRKKFNQLPGDKESQEEKIQQPVLETGVDKAEFNLLQLILLKNDKINDFIYQHMDAENFINPAMKKIMQLLTHRLNRGNSIKADDLYLESWNEIEQKLLSKIIGESENLEDKEETILYTLALDCIEKILLNQIDNEINEIRIKMKNAPQTGDDIVDLMHDYKNRQEQKKLISETLRQMENDE